jgi:hypothetical protein
MNKLELIIALKDEARITKTEADLFFDTMADLFPSLSMP